LSSAPGLCATVSQCAHSSMRRRRVPPWISANEVHLVQLAPEALDAHRQAMPPSRSVMYRRPAGTPGRSSNRGPCAVERIDVGAQPPVRSRHIVRRLRSGHGIGHGSGHGNDPEVPVRSARWAGRTETESLGGRVAVSYSLPSIGRFRTKCESRGRRLADSHLTSPIATQLWTTSFPCTPT
jgi:hypothetical protein